MFHFTLDSSIDLSSILFFILVWFSSLWVSNSFGPLSANLKESCMKLPLSFTIVWFRTSSILSKRSFPKKMYHLALFSPNEKGSCLELEKSKGLLKPLFLSFITQSILGVGSSFFFVRKPETTRKKLLRVGIQIHVTGQG